MLKDAQIKALTKGAEGCNFPNVYTTPPKRRPKRLAKKLLETRPITLRLLDWLVVWDALRTVLCESKPRSVLSKAISYPFVKIGNRLVMERMLYVARTGALRTWYDQNEAKKHGK